MMDLKVITFDEEIEKVKSILEKDDITEEEKYYLTAFAKNMGLRQILYSNDIASETMKKELKRIIDTIPKSPETKAKNFFVNSYNDFYLKEVQNNINSQSQSQSNGLSQERAYVRVRTNNNSHFSSSNSSDDYSQNSSSGFSNILLILLSTATCGLILGILLINYLN